MIKKIKYDPLLHHRRSIRLKDYDYSQPGAYFVTMVAQDCANLFGKIQDEKMVLNTAGDIIQLVWQQLPRFFTIDLDEMVIMPNHLHGIIWIFDRGTGEASALLRNANLDNLAADASPQHLAIGTQPGSLGAIIQNFKSVSTRKINQWSQVLGKGKATTGINPETIKSSGVNASPQRVCQRNYYEHIIRNQNQLDAVREYIVDNPRRWTEDKEYRE